MVPVGGALAGWAAAYVLGADQLDGLDPHTQEPLTIPLHLGRSYFTSPFAHLCQTART